MSVAGGGQRKYRSLLLAISKEEEEKEEEESEIQRERERECVCVCVRDIKRATKTWRNSLLVILKEKKKKKKKKKRDKVCVCVRDKRSDSTHQSSSRPYPRESDPCCAEQRTEALAKALPR